MLKRILSKIFSRKKSSVTPEEEEVDELLISEENTSASITITLDSESSDFNVIVDINEVSDECAFVLGSLLGMLNNGHLSAYFTKAYQSWCDGDYEKQIFVSKMMINWLEMDGSFSSEYDNVAVKPSQVFNFSMKE
tara:strand:- start:10057 stop:10464 length:408 start_codon:yes stop_codon:yes gene_type:complete